MDLWSALRATDPEFSERLTHFAFHEVVDEPGLELDPATRHTAILAALLGCQGLEVFERLALPQALDDGLSPVAVKEIVYQAVDYLGMGRVLPFLEAANRVLTAGGLPCPCPARPPPPWTTAWSGGPRLRRTSSAPRCWRRGSPARSTVGWPPTALAITTPAPG